MGRRGFLYPTLRAYGWLTERLYHEMAWAYDAVSWLVSAGQWAKWRQSVLEYIIGPDVLELGFGTGELLMAIRGAGLNPTGLEPSWEMQRVTAKKLGQQGLGSIPRVCGQGQRLPFADGSFDSAVATFPASYVVEPDTLCEVHRVLRTSKSSEGRFVILGLLANLGGRTTGWISRESLAGRTIGSQRLPGWDIRIVDRSRKALSMPILVLERVRHMGQH